MSDLKRGDRVDVSKAWTESVVKTGAVLQPEVLDFNDVPFVIVRFDYPIARSGRLSARTWAVPAIFVTRAEFAP